MRAEKILIPLAWLNIAILVIMVLYNLVAELF